MKYAHVQDGKVVATYSEVPAILGNVTGLDKAASEELPGFGLHLITYQRPDFNSDTHKLSEPTHIVGLDGVTATHDVIPLTSDEIALNLNEIKHVALNALKNNKNYALLWMDYCINSVHYTVSIGVEDQVNLQTRIVTLAGSSPDSSIQWEIVDNVFVSWNLDDLKDLRQAISDHSQSIYDAASKIVECINNATSVSAVKSISLNVL